MLAKVIRLRWSTLSDDRKWRLYYSTGFICDCPLQLSKYFYNTGHWPPGVMLKWRVELEKPPRETEKNKRGATTLSLMAFDIITFSINDILAEYCILYCYLLYWVSLWWVSFVVVLSVIMFHVIILSVIKFNVNMLSIIIFSNSDECHYVEWHYVESLYWVSLCSVSLYWVSLCTVSLCWESLCWVSLW